MQPYEEDADLVLPTRAGSTENLLRRAFRVGVACNLASMPAGRHPRDLGILSVTAVVEPCSQRRVGDLLQINRTVMVKLVDALERDGLVRRERDPADRRNYALRVTTAGREAAARMRDGIAKGEADLLAPLTADEAGRLGELLARIAAPPAPEIPAELAGLVGFLLPRAYHQARAWVLEPLAGLGIAPRHLGILNVLAGLAPCSQQRLAGELGITGPAVVAALSELEHRGLIDRHRDSRDRRQHVLVLTPAAHRMLAGLNRTPDRLAEALGGADLDELNRILGRLIR